MDSVNKLTINNAKHYEPSTATANEAQGNITQNLETVTHTSNINFEQKLLIYWTIPVLPPPTKPDIDQWIAPIILELQTILMPVTNKVITDTASRGAWIQRTHRQVSRKGVDRSTPCNIRNAIGIVEPPYPVMIVIIGTYPPCGLNASQEVGNKRHPTYLGLIRQSPKLGSVVAGKLSDDQDLTLIFSKVIGDKLSEGSSQDIYTRGRKNFAGRFRSKPDTTIHGYVFFDK